MAEETVLVLDFGGQYKELIARRVRECRVHAVIKPGNLSAGEIEDMAPVGIILTGGPDSVYREGAPSCDARLFKLGIPILGICYGMQLMIRIEGGGVAPCAVSEYGRTDFLADTSSALFRGLPERQVGLMSHTDRVDRLPTGFRAIAQTEHCPFAAVENAERRLYGTQFHPEVENTPFGREILHNFLFHVCGTAGNWNLLDYEAKAIGDIRRIVGKEQVVLGLSGGVDSSVCAALLAKAVPNQLHCIFVDHGLMRKDEGDEVEKAFRRRALHFIRVNAGERFLRVLSGVTDPEQKRKRIGEEFIRVFEEEAGRLGGAAFLAQGTIYPDVIESGTGGATIKSHHNVGGLPENMAFLGLVEPLRGLFKDEVRALGRQLGLPRRLCQRQPFPGPGLAVRCVGEVTEERLRILREADAIFRVEMRRARAKADQYFAVLTGTRSVGVVGDFRRYGETVALRAVRTTDFMTCEVIPLPHALLGRVAARIVNELPGVSRVVYDITGKPPATIEWE